MSVELIKIMKEFQNAGIAVRIKLNAFVDKEVVPVPTVLKGMDVEPNFTPSEVKNPEVKKPEKKTKKAEETKLEPKKEETKTLTLEEVREKFIKVMTEKSKPEAQKVLHSFRASKLSELKEEDFAEVLSQLNALLGE